LRKRARTSRSRWTDPLSFGVVVMKQGGLDCSFAFHKAAVGVERRIAGGGVGLGAPARSSHGLFLFLCHASM